MYNSCKYICVNNSIITLYTSFALIGWDYSTSRILWWSARTQRYLFRIETYERTCSSLRNDDRHWESYRISFPLVVRTRTSTQSTRCLWARSKCHEYRQVFSEGEPVIGNEWVFRVTFFFLSRTFMTPLRILNLLPERNSMLFLSTIKLDRRKLQGAK